MKYFIHSAVAAIGGFVCLVSCAEQESDLLSVNQSSNNQLRVVTHTRVGEEPVSSAASVYLFNDENAFVRILQTDANGDYVSAKLPEDTYTLYAYGGDLSHFQLPDDASITPSTAITLADDQDMGDLLMATSTVTLPDGTDEVVDLTLQRKVLELSSITISQVPAGVTGVSVAIAPFYSAIQINGDYVSTAPVTATFTLTETATSGVWQATPQQLVFPSKGVPTITVTFTRDGEDPSSYTYTADAALSANNKYDIVGTYTEPLGVTLSGGITLQPWTTNPAAVNFEFDESNIANSGAGGVDLIPGQMYNDYYVVSVDEMRREAVLLSNNHGTVEDNTQCQNFLSNISKPQEAIGNWRIPTVLECQAFLSNPDTPGIFVNSSENYFCYKEGALYRCKAEKSSDGTVAFTLKAADYNNQIYLRPVIDIRY